MRCCDSPIAVQFLGDPEADGWGCLSMIVSMIHYLFERADLNIDSQTDHGLLSPLCAIVSSSVRSACGEGVTALIYAGVEITLEVQILGALLDYTRFGWAQELSKTPGRAALLQASLEAELVNMALHSPLHCILTTNAKALAEEILWEMYTNGTCADCLTEPCFFKALSSLFSVFFATFYVNSPLVDHPERHAKALACAVLACGEHINTIAGQDRQAVLDTCDVLHAVLLCDTALPRADLFRIADLIMSDNVWVSRQRVGKALASVNFIAHGLDNPVVAMD